MSGLFSAAAAILAAAGVVEGIRACSLLLDRDPETRRCASAAGLLLCAGLLFLVMARVDG